MANRLGFHQLATALERTFAHTLAHKDDSLVISLRSKDHSSNREGFPGQILDSVRHKIAWAGCRAMALASLRSLTQRTQRWLTMCLPDHRPWLGS
jgi:hypothetical protein